MKKISIYVCFASAILSSLLSCSKNESSSNCGPIEFKVIELQKTDSAASTCSVVVVDESLEDKFLIITSREELLSKISFKSAGPNPLRQELETQFQNIDFDKEVLLIGKAVTPQIPARLIEQQVNKDCKSDEIIYKVKYKQGDYASFGLFKFAVIIPKTEARSISLDILRIAS
jgi:hypothetical protein